MQKMGVKTGFAGYFFPPLRGMMAETKKNSAGKPGKSGKSDTKKMTTRKI
jgi:hypothetical protein